MAKILKHSRCATNTPNFKQLFANEKHDNLKMLQVINCILSKDTNCKYARDVYNITLFEIEDNTDLRDNTFAFFKNNKNKLNECAGQLVDQLSSIFKIWNKESREEVNEYYIHSDISLGLDALELAKALSSEDGNILDDETLEQVAIDVADKVYEFKEYLKSGFNYCKEYRMPNIEDYLDIEDYEEDCGNSDLLYI